MTSDQTHDERIRERIQRLAVPERLASDWKQFFEWALVGERTAAAASGELEETQALAAARAWADEADAGVLLFLGAKGVGKTVAAAWALAQISRVHYSVCACDVCEGHYPVSACLVGEGHAARFTIVRQSIGPTVARFVKAGHMVNALHENGGRAQWEDFARVDALVIDDLGREYADQHGRWTAELDLLIDDRHEARRRTIITSNLNGTEFKERYGERVADRIRQDGRIVVCSGDSMRKAVS